MRGLIGGFGAGLLTAVLGFAAVSLIAPLPERAATAPGPDAPVTKAPVTKAPGTKAVGTSPAIADLPEGAEFDSAGAERAPKLAPPAGAPVAGGAAPAAPMPESATPEPAMSGMTPPARPEAGAGSEMAQPAPATAEVALAAPVEAEAPVPVPPPGEVETPALLPAEGDGAAPAASGAMPQEGAAAVLTDPGARGAGAEAAPETTPKADRPATEAPATTETATDPATAAPALAPPASPELAQPAEGGAAGTDVATALPSLPPVLVPETSVEPAPEIVLLPDGSPVPDATLPRVFRPDGSTTFKPSATPGAGLPEVAGVRVNRLPTIGTDPAAPADGALPQADALIPGAGAGEDSPALRRYATPFTGAEGLPRYAVVIVDEGEAAGGLDRTTLKTLGFPVTVAIDPERPDAAQAAAEYRAAGLEVAILARGLPLGATAADLEVALEDWHRKLPEAIAVVEPARPLIQNNRPLAQQLVKILAREGLGLVTQRQGLNAAAQIAGSEGLPEAEIWRVLDTARDDAPVIERTLSRAAFEAQREGQVAVMISSWPQSVAGLMSWAAAGEGKVALAPVSALMPEGKF